MPSSSCKKNLKTTKFSLTNRSTRLRIERLWKKSTRETALVPTGRKKAEIPTCKTVVSSQRTPASSRKICLNTKKLIRRCKTKLLCSSKGYKCRMTIWLKTVPTFTNAGWMEKQEWPWLPWVHLLQSLVGKAWCHQRMSKTWGTELTRTPSSEFRIIRSRL